MEMHRGDDGVECVVAKPGESPNMEKFAEEVKKQLIATSKLFEMAMVDLVPVVRCKDCQHCRLLNDGVSFKCTSWEMCFYAPTYNAATYYCADGKRRKTNDTSH